ncbi:MAG: DUF6585 family protein [Chloroflexota bacterium]
MGSLGNRLREYGFAWPELLREFLLLGIIIIPVTAGLMADKMPDEAVALIQTMLLVWFILFITTGVFLSRKPKIVVYDNGIGLKERDDERNWSWNQITRWDGQRNTLRVNGIPMLRTGANHFYVGDEKIFSVGTHRACANQLAGLLIMKMAQANGVPRDYVAYQDGKTIQYSGVKINKNGLGGNKQSVRWEEIEQMDFKNDQLRVKRLTDKKLRKFGYVSPIASYSLMGLLDRVRRTDFIERKTVELSRSQAQIWASQGKQVVLIMLIVVPILAGVIWILSNADQHGQVSNDGLRQINAQFGSNIGIACTDEQLNTYTSGSTENKKHKFLVIDATDNNNLHIHDDFQTALPLKEQAVSGKDLTTVVCVWEYVHSVDKCDYCDVTHTRYSRDYGVSVIEIGSKTILNENVIPGTKPPSCPKTDPGDDLYGSFPSSAAFSTWLRSGGTTSGNSV